MNKIVKILTIGGFVAVAVGCANKEVVPHTVSVEDVVAESNLPQVYVDYHGSRYVNTHTLEYAKEAVQKKQAIVNAEAEKANQGFFSKNK